MNDSSLLERNLKALFAIHDADADGFITFDDLMALGTRLCEQLNITGSPVAAAIVDIYVSWWEQLRAAGAAHLLLSSDQAHPGTSMLGLA
jgi:hypothetical protein